MVFSLEKWLLFFDNCGFLFMPFQITRAPKHKAYEKNISTNSWKMYYFAALEAEIFYFRWIDVYVSKFSVSNYSYYIYSLSFKCVKISDIQEFLV